MVRVLNVSPAAPVIDFDVPVKVTPALLAVKVPVFVQFPAIVISPVPWVMFPEPLTSPVTFTLLLLLFNAAAPPVTLQLPPTVNVPAAGVFVPPPENVRFG